MYVFARDVETPTGVYRQGLDVRIVRRRPEMVVDVSPVGMIPHHVTVEADDLDWVEHGRRTTTPMTTDAADRSRAYSLAAKKTHGVVVPVHLLSDLIDAVPTPVRSAVYKHLGPKTIAAVHYRTEREPDAQPAPVPVDAVDLGDGRRLPSGVRRTRA